MDFPEGQFWKDIATNSPYQEGTIEQEYNRLTEEHHRDNPDLRKQINTSKVVYKFSPKESNQTYRKENAKKD